ncbi:hypothetical protein [Peptostreptococcus faecalis]|uniref:hypothetical protein n=1 Tax=Peptostreptococcus faecalis TaxID=2045015 RepID=UPI000C7DA273|nr:hypothetical protein [Peptostreptococcus faecalis]
MNELYRIVHNLYIEEDEKRKELIKNKQINIIILLVVTVLSYIFFKEIISKYSNNVFLFGIIQLAFFLNYGFNAVDFMGKNPYKQINSGDYNRYYKELEKYNELDIVKTTKDMCETNINDMLECIECNAKINDMKNNKYNEVQEALLLLIGAAIFMTVYLLI